MKFVHGVAVQNVAIELRELQWDRFVDGAGIRSNLEQGSLIAKQIRQAWELAHPIAKYYSAAEEKMKQDTIEYSPLPR